jgi:hypothetical protein
VNLLKYKTIAGGEIKECSSPLLVQKLRKATERVEDKKVRRNK